MDSVIKVIEAAKAADDIDEDTHLYLLECLRDADSSDWQDIVQDFLPLQALEAIVAIAPASQPENTEFQFVPTPRVAHAPAMLSRTETVMSAIPEDAEKHGKPKLTVGSFYAAHPDESRGTRHQSPEGEERKIKVGVHRRGRLPLAHPHRKEAATSRIYQCVKTSP